MVEKKTKKKIPIQMKMNNKKQKKTTIDEYYNYYYNYINQGP